MAKQKFDYYFRLVKDEESDKTNSHNQFLAAVIEVFIRPSERGFYDHMTAICQLTYQKDTKRMLSEYSTLHWYGESMERLTPNAEDLYQIYVFWNKMETLQEKLNLRLKDILECRLALLRGIGAKEVGYRDHRYVEVEA